MVQETEVRSVKKDWYKKFANKLDVMVVILFILFLLVWIIEKLYFEDVSEMNGYIFYGIRIGIMVLDFQIWYLAKVLRR